MIREIFIRVFSIILLLRTAKRNKKMDGFGDNFDQTDVDPAAEFLAREKDQLAGLEDELETKMGMPSNNDDGETTNVNASGM